MPNTSRLFDMVSKIEGGQCYKPWPSIQDAEQLNPSDKSSKTSTRGKIRNLAHKEAQTSAHVFMHIPACRPGIITSTIYVYIRTASQEHLAPTLSNPQSLSSDTRVFESFVANMQFSLNILAILAASASMVSATQFRRYAHNKPVQYGDPDPWTSSTCSAVYSTIMETKTKPVKSVVSTTIWKPSTYTSTVPTVITSVYTTYKPATTTLTSTVTSVYVG
jgi:hypothetical protein